MEALTTTPDTNQDTGLYTAEEQAYLDKTLKLRMQMIDETFKEGVPKHGGTIRVMNEVMSAIDTAINNKAMARLKQTDTKNQNEIKEQVAEMLRQQSRKLQENKRANVEEEIEITPEQIASLGGVPTFVPGETEIENKIIEAADILGEELING